MNSVADPDPSDPYFFCGLDPDPDPFVSGMNPDPSIIKQNSKKNLDSYCFLTLYLWEKNSFLLASWRSMTKGQDPDPLVRGMDSRVQIRIRIHTKMSWIRNNGWNYNNLPCRRAWPSSFCSWRAPPTCSSPAPPPLWPEASARSWGSRRSSTCSTSSPFTKVPVSSVPYPDPPDPHVFGPPGSGSGSTTQRYGSGSGSFYHHAKIERKTLIPSILWLFLTFYLWKMM